MPDVGPTHAAGRPGRLKGGVGWLGRLPGRGLGSLVSAPLTMPAGLRHTERCGLILVGVVLWAAWCAHSQPGSSHTTERDGRDRLVKTTTTSVDRGPVILVLVPCGLALVLVELNGRRVASFTLGPVTGSTVREEAKAADQYAQSGEAPSDVSVPSGPVPELEEPPALPPSGDTVIDGEAQDVYGVDALPWRVLTDLYTYWPGGRPPRTVPPWSSSRGDPARATMHGS
jgi:hypothetical protein